MSKHNDQFMQMFGDSLKNYAPEVPTGVYAGIRGKMKKKSFFSFSMTSLNIWYILLAGGVAAGAYTLTASSETMVAQQIKSTSQMDEAVYRPHNYLIATVNEDKIEDVEMISTNTLPNGTSDAMNNTASSNKSEEGLNDSVDNNQTVASEEGTVETKDEEIARTENNVPEKESSELQNDDLATQDEAKVSLWQKVKGMRILNLRKQIEEDDTVVLQVQTSK